MNLDAFFNPRTIAVVGVSSNPSKVGRVIFDNLLHAKKNVYPINPNLEYVNGAKCYRSLTELGKVDVIFICVPVDPTLQVMEEAGKLGIRNAVIITSGFKEVGNYEADKKLEHMAKKYKINVIGPNCLGIMNMQADMDAIFLPESRLSRPKKGGISFITQSGATGSVILDVIGSMGISKFISYGNALNLNECDYLEYLAKDKTTDIICVYVEGVKDGKRFLDVCRKIKKPIVIMKGGKTAQGSKAALSHTGSLAGDAAIYSGVFKQLGLLEVDGIREMINILQILKSKIKGRSVGVVTNGGGYGILSVDDLVTMGLDFKGPVVDLFGDASPEGYKRAINAMKTDIILCNVLFQTPLIDESIIDILAEAHKKKYILVVTTGSSYVQDMKQKLAEKGIPVFDTPEEAVDALRLVIQR